MGGVGPRDTHSCASAQLEGPSLEAGLVVSVDGEELGGAKERRGAGDRRELTLGLHPSLVRLQVSNP